jgi:exodeoxyribonuclease VII small subunit
MPKATTPKAVEELSFEEAFTELDAVVSLLENEPQALDEAMKLFERGQALARRCSALLDQAELKLRQLSGDALVELESVD